MHITHTSFEDGFVEMELSDGTEDGEAIVFRMRSKLATTERLARLQLAILQQARDVIGPEIQNLKRTLDQVD